MSELKSNSSATTALRLEMIIMIHLDSGKNSGMVYIVRRNVKKSTAMEKKEMNLEKRSAKEVFEEHLELAQKGEVEKDIERNYAPDAVLLTNYGVFRGKKGLEEAAALLEKQLPGGSFDYRLKLCHDDICFLQWTGKSKISTIPDGADSFSIKNGKIQVQTIYYSVEKNP